jgi:hypothetical protein
VNADAGLCTASGVSLGSATTADNCSVASVTNDAPATYPLGNTTVTWTVTDGSGRTATATQTVTVLDTQLPEISDMPSSFIATNTCAGAVSWAEPTASDNCSVSLTSNYGPGDNFPVGTTTVIYTATDGSGNTATSSFTITINSVAISASGSTALCNGGATGSATVVVTNAQGPVTYSWSPGGATTQTVNNLSAGTYMVTVVNSGCIVVDTAVVVEPTAMAGTASVTHRVTCFEGADGAVTVSASGGTGAYSYLWTPGGSTSASVSGLTAGTYTVRVTDANGCSITRSAAPAEPADFNITEVVTTPLCNGNTNGSIAVTVTGSNGGYSYSWSTGATTSTLSGIGAGTYNIAVTDIDGCSSAKDITVTQPDVLAVSVVGTDITCYGARDGQVQATVTGGTTAYSYAWYSTSSGSPITGQTASLLTGRSPGSYYVRVTDAKACSVTSSTVTLTQPPVLLVSVSKTNVSCFGGANGTANASASGGNGGYQYYWTRATTTTPVVVGTTARITGLIAGSYTVRVTDSKGCVRYATVTITQPATALSVSVSRSGSSATATPSGGTSPYTYLWSTGARTATVSGLVSGIVYSVRVTDRNGCTVTGYTAASREEDPNFFQQQSMDAKVYPNPTTGDLTLEFNAADQDHYRINVLDFSGRIIDVTEGTATMGLNTYRYDLSGLAKGIYLVRVERAGEVQVLRLVLE